MAESARHEITQRELRNDSGAIMRAVECGESFTVTRNGTRARYGLVRQTVGAGSVIAPAMASIASRSACPGSSQGGRCGMRRIRSNASSTIGP